MYKLNNFKHYLSPLLLIFLMDSCQTGKSSKEAIIESSMMKSGSGGAAAGAAAQPGNIQDDVLHENTHLYKITFKGKPFFLLGTAHNIDLSMMSPIIRTLIDQSSNFAIESKQPFNMEQLTQDGFFDKTKDNKFSWFDSPQLRQQAIPIIENMQLKSNVMFDISNLSNLGFIHLILRSNFLGADFEIQQIAKEKDVDLNNLFALEEEEKIPLEVANDLVVNLESLTDFTTQLIASKDDPEMIRAKSNYLRGTIPQLLEQFIFESHEKRELNRRNKKMATQLLKLLRSKDQLFAAVGVAHLYHEGTGGNSLLNILTRKGCLVEPIP